MRLRHLRAELDRDLPEGSLLQAGPVQLRTLASGRSPPVVSTTRYQSREVPDGAELVDEGGAVAGRLVATTILEAGGRWDTWRRSYVAEGEAPLRPLVYDLMESQVEPATWYAAWLRRFKARQGDPRRLKVRDKRAVLHYGNRAGGKTELSLWLVLAAAVSVPGSICWVVSASRPQSQEDVHERLQDLVPEAWGAYRGQPAYRWRLINDSRLREMTADNPTDLKNGRVDIAVLNEAQKMDLRAYSYTIGRISDRGGILWLAANPPTADTPKGEWVKRMADDLKDAEAQGKSLPIQIMKSSGADNAAIDQGAREDVAELLRMVSPEIAAADADGEMRELQPRLIYTWDRSRFGLHPAPEMGDITYEFTKRKYNRGFPWLAGLDFQDSPYIIASFWKVYGSLDRPILWCAADFTCQGSEDDFLDELLLGGIPLEDGRSEEIEPGTVLWIGDSSAQWQDRKNRGQQATVLPPSFSFWKNRGLIIVPPTMKITPDAKYAKNPPLQVSYGQVNRLVSEDRMRLAPRAKVLQQAFKECAAKPRASGGVQAEAKWAHAIDTARYVAWWVDPVTKRRKPQQGGGPLVYGVPGL